MFGRILEARRILKHQYEPIHPDSEPTGPSKLEYPTSESRFSSFGGKLFEGAFFFAVVAACGKYAGAWLHSKVELSVSTLTALVSGLAAIIGQRLLDEANHKLLLQLKIGQRLAPYFGHRLERSYKILKG